jgi:hypothetical protein
VFSPDFDDDNRHRAAANAPHDAPSIDSISPRIGIDAQRLGVGWAWIAGKAVDQPADTLPDVARQGGHLPVDFAPDFKPVTQQLPLLHPEPG